MAVIKVELNLDWLGEGDNVDEKLRDEVIEAASAHLTAATQKAVDKQLAEYMKALEKGAADRIEKYLDMVLSTKITELKIPQIKGGYWDDKVEFISLTKFIGEQYERYLTEKRLDQNGGTAQYNSDKKYSISEYLINQYLSKELTPKVEKLIREAREKAEKDICGTLEATLQKQLTADIIAKLNIPEMLKALKEKGKQLAAPSKDEKK